MSADQLSRLKDRLSELSRRFRVTLPELDPGFEIHDLAGAEHVRQLAETQDIVIRGCGVRNVLFMHPAAGRRRGTTTLEMNGDDNIVVIDADCGVQGYLKFHDNGNLAVFSGGQHLFGLEAHFKDASTLLCGREAFAWGIRVWAFGGAHCVIGDDCLFSESISIRTTDHHSLIDLQTWKQTNFPADIVFEPHVWVGQGVMVAKGVRIGAGAVIAQASVVVKSIPGCEIWGGAPARMIRRNFSWVRSHPAEGADLAALRAVLPSAGQRGAGWLGKLWRLWAGNITNDRGGHVGD